MTIMLIKPFASVKAIDIHAVETTVELSIPNQLKKDLAKNSGLSNMKIYISKRGSWVRYKKLEIDSAEAAFM